MGAAIDAILGIMVRQGANELRVGTGRVPRILRDGTPKRLTMRETSASELWHLVGALLSPEAEQALRDGQRGQLVYDAGALGSFRVVIEPRKGEEGFDAVFIQTTERVPPADEGTARELAAPLVSPVFRESSDDGPALAPGRAKSM